eukprot:m.338194 g.338194  ORF g.338194 m.338194 type:complete len:100 (-) comp18335_c0_seq1:1032-1331(-)
MLLVYILLDVSLSLYPSFPSSFFFCHERSEWKITESIIPATVKTPPIIAHKLVKKWARDLLVSVSCTTIGDNSNMKNTPGRPDSPSAWFITRLCEVTEY